MPPTTSYINVSGSSSYVSVAIGENDTLWIAAGKDLIKYKDGYSKIYNSENSYLSSFAQLKNIVYNKHDNTIWMIDARGHILDFDRLFCNTYEDEFKFDNFDVHPYDITIDKDGNIWVANIQFSGIAKFDGEDWSNYMPSNSGIKSCVLEFLESYKNKLYIGTYEGLYVKDNQEWFRPIKSESFHNRHRAACADERGLWFDLNGLALLKDDGSIDTIRNNSNQIYDLNIAQDGIVWFCYTPNNNYTNINTYGGDKGNYPYKETPRHIITCIAFDSQNNVWFAEGNNVISKYDGTDKEEVTIEINGVPNIKYSGYDIAVDINDNIWIATLYGLIKYDHENFIRFDNISAGFPFTSITHIEFDSHNNLWCLYRPKGYPYEKGGFCGIAYFNGEEWSFWDYRNSPLGIDVLDFCIDDNDNLLIASSGKVFIMNPEFSQNITTMNEQLNVTLYPNPVNDQLYIKGIINANINIYSTTGELLITCDGSNINTSNLSPGVYYIKIHDGENIYHKSFIKN